MPSKEPYINQLFDSIANYYDLANTVLSMGRDQYWRKYTAQLVRKYTPAEVVDLCSGTGMLALAIARENQDCRVTGIDFSQEMLQRGGEHLTRFPESERIKLQYGNAMKLEFDDNRFDCATLGFSLRNVDDLQQVLREMKRVVRPGGAVITLELSKPKIPVFREIYYAYFYKLVPRIGKVICGKLEPYHYLPNSLTMFPDRQQLEGIYREVGFTNVRSFPLTGGIAAIHVGEKLDQPCTRDHFLN